MPDCKWRFAGLPVLTYLEYAALRCSKTTLFGSVWTKCRRTRRRILGGISTTPGHGPRPTLGCWGGESGSPFQGDVQTSRIEPFSIGFDIAQIEVGKVDIGSRFAHIAGDLLHPAGARAVLQRVAIAPRCALVPAAMHPATRAAPNGRRAAGRTGAGAGAAARSGGEDRGLNSRGMALSVVFFVFSLTASL